MSEVPARRLVESAPAPREMLQQVGVSYVRRHLAQGGSRCGLLLIAGFSAEDTSALAEALSEQIDHAVVRIPRTLAEPWVDEALVADEPATYWRNVQRESDWRVVICAEVPEQLNQLQPGVSLVRRISAQTLLDAPNLWLDTTPNIPGSGRDRQLVREVLSGAISASMIQDAKDFAEGVARLDRAMSRLPIEQALGWFLPALRLPPGSVRFKKPGARGRITSAATWAKRFTEAVERYRTPFYLIDRQGKPVDRDALRSRVEELEQAGELEPEQAQAFRDLLDERHIEPGRWLGVQQAAVELPWDVSERVFGNRRRQRTQALGQLTREFLRQETTRELTESEEALLEGLTSETQEPSEDERQFFERHRARLERDKTLFKRWERLVYRRNDRAQDLLIGLFEAVADLTRQQEDPLAQPWIHVRLTGAQERSYWDEKNTDLRRWLRDRYRGLDRLFEGIGSFDSGMCWREQLEEPKDPEVDEVVGTERCGAPQREFRFDLYLIERAEAKRCGGVPDDEVLDRAPRARVTWTPSAESLARSFSVDVRDIAQLGEARCALLVGSFAARTGPEAVLGGPSLGNRASLLDAQGGADGRLVCNEGARYDMAALARNEIRKLRENRILPGEDAQAIEESFGRFHEAYTRAVRALVSPGGEGISSGALLEQAQCYGELLDVLRSRGRAERVRTLLWRALLRFGVAEFDNVSGSVIVTPWHPLRLAEIAAKGRLFREACALAVSRQFRDRVDERAHFAQIAGALGSPFYPEVCLHVRSASRTLLLGTQFVDDYELFEQTFGAESEHGSDARGAASACLEVVDEYLRLRPHERANFSVALFNNENAELPGLLTQHLATKVDQEDDLRCDLLLTHKRPTRLQQIYQEQNIAIGSALSGGIASEATRSFLARLRVGFVPSSLPDAPADGSRAIDLVLLHDVIARQSEVGWEPRRSAGDTKIETHNPCAGSRRCPIDPGSDHASVYLADPSAPEPQQAYLNCLRELSAEGSEGAADWVPVRRVRFQSPAVSEVVKRSHALGDWVVTYDAIADRRLLRGNNIRIIRHLTRPESRNNLIVSTMVDGGSLRERLDGHVRRLMKDPTASEVPQIIEECLDRGAKISGRMVLEATRRDNAALELIGLVLTRETAALEVEEEGYAAAAVLPLDDFGRWLGHEGGQIADLLLVGLREGSDGILEVELNAAESKCVHVDSWGEQARKSGRQAQSSYDVLTSRFDEARAAAAGLWRQRLADLLLEHGETDVIGERGSVSRWVQEIRDGNARVSVRGRSYVFTHGSGEMEPSRENIAEGVEQQVFSPWQTTRALRSLATGTGSEALRPLREAPGDSTCEGYGPEPRRQAGDSGHEGQARGVDEREGEQERSGADEEARAERTERGGDRGDREERGALDEGAVEPRSAYPPFLAEWLAERVAVLDGGAGEELAISATQEMQRALRALDMSSEALGSRVTPNAIVMSFRGSESLTVGALTRRKTDIGTRFALPVLEILPGRGEITVMVERAEREILPLEMLWQQRVASEEAPEANAGLVIGSREDNGKILYLTPLSNFAGQQQSSPHTLIAGNPGSGKSILVSNLILDICATNAPSRAKIHLIDPKHGLDYLWAEGLPHLEPGSSGGAITEMEESKERLLELVEVMEQRYALMKEAGAKNIAAYNAKVSLSERLPVIWVVHDEFADWMTDESYHSAVQTAVERLGIKARAAGIFLIFVAQRPSQDVMPMQLRDNLGNRLVLRVAGENTAKVAGVRGAENLLGKGHLAARMEGVAGTVFCQVPFIADEDLERLAGRLGRYWREREGR